MQLLQHCGCIFFCCVFGDSFIITLSLFISSAPRSGSNSPSPDSYSLYCYPCTWADCVTSDPSVSPDPAQPAQACWSHPRGGGAYTSNVLNTPLLSTDSAQKNYSTCPRPRPVAQNRFAPFGALNPFANPGHTHTSDWLTTGRNSPTLIPDLISSSPKQPQANQEGSECGPETPSLEEDAVVADPASGSVAVAKGAEGGAGSSWRPPAELCWLSVEEVSSSLRFIGLSDDVIGLFSRERIDGSIFTQLTEEILSEDFKLTKLQVKKTMQFIKGWRPKIWGQHPRELKEWFCLRDTRVLQPRVLLLGLFQMFYKCVCVCLKYTSLIEGLTDRD